MPQGKVDIQKKIQEKFGGHTSVIGGKGAVRRKFKATSKSSTQDDKRLHGQLKKLNVNVIPAIDEVNLFKDDGTVVHFTKPKVQAEITSNTYVISGHCETKKNRRFNSTNSSSIRCRTYGELEKIGRHIWRIKTTNR